MAEVPVDADRRDGQRHHLRHEALVGARARRVELDRHRVGGGGRLEEVAVGLGAVGDADGGERPGRAVVEVAVVERDVVRDPGLAVAGSRMI